MQIKYKVPSTSEEILIVGDNYLSDQLYKDFRRYSKLRPNRINNILEFKKDNISYIIDCTLNIDSVKNLYVKNLNAKKIIILSEKIINLDYKLNFIQVLLTDIYSYEHESFNRVGFGNSDDLPIENNKFICESMRRMHECKVSFIPNLYLNINQDNIKYLNINNLYKYMDYIIYNVKDFTHYEIYDECKPVGFVLDILKRCVEYNGNVVLETYENIKDDIKPLPFRCNGSLESNIKQIYKYLIYNNKRFDIFN